MIIKKLLKFKVLFPDELRHLLCLVSLRQIYYSIPKNY